MKVLIPILAGQDLSAEFIDQATSGADEVVLLGVFDAEKMILPAGAGMNMISEIEKTAEAIAVNLQRQGVNHKVLTQWGDMERIITNTAKLNKTNKIVMKKTSADYFKELVATLKRETQCKLEIVN